MFGDAASSPGPLLRPTRMLSPTRGGFGADSEQTDSTDNTTDQGSDDSHTTPSHAGRSEGGLPRTIPLAATTPDRAASPTKRPSPTLNISATLGRANSFSGNGGAGARRIAPLAASTTGTRYGAALMGELRSNNTGSPVRQWGSGTPQCPRCTKNVYFAEQVRPPLSEPLVLVESSRFVGIKTRSRQLARRGTKRVFVVRSVVRPSIRAASRRETGVPCAIGVTTRFAPFRLRTEILVRCSLT